MHMYMLYYIYMCVCVMQKLGLTPDEIHTMIATAQQDTATEGIAMHLQHLLRDMMHNTCFTIQGLNRPCQTTDDKIIYFHVFFLGQMRWTVLFPS